MEEFELKSVKYNINKHIALYTHLADELYE